MYNKLSCFHFEMEFIPGKDNVITDSLSCVWECDSFVASDSDFIHEPDLDSLFDPDTQWWTQEVGLVESQMFGEEDGGLGSGPGDVLLSQLE
jgi:hypothetical protein